ncbi:MAG TPA: hypothetical protein VHB46_16370 [Burkholderiales bacterium]|nr:hypothetical protein [Burkholderiales bacterium]
MKLACPAWFSKHVVFPLWELKDGSHRQRYLRELLASQWWSPRQILDFQWSRLREMVGYSFSNVPYYAARYASIGFNGKLESLDDFRRLPLLTKADIRENPDALVSTQFRKSDLVESRTGGSTGTALTLLFDQQCQELRNAAAMRSDGWAGWDLGMKVAAIWGNPPVAATLKEKLRSALLERTIYLDTMDMNAESVRRFVEEWRSSHPRIIFGHSHSIFILAKFLREMQIGDLKPLGIISTSMMLLAPEREYIEQTFGCPVTNRYGCEEVGLIASECERHDGLHLNLEHVFVEFLRDDGSVASPGEEANIVVTDLNNRGMPLIRYRVGDMGVPTDRTCACGRGQPLMERIAGRQADFLKRPNGSMVAGVSLVERTLTAIPGIEQMQLVQDDLLRLTVNLVTATQYDAKAEKDLRVELGSVFGDEVTIDLRYVASLDQSRSGKYRFAICNV